MKVIEVKPEQVKEKTKEARVVIELKQSELDALGSLLCDVMDPARGVVLNYTIDKTKMVPTKHFRKTLKKLSRFVEDPMEPSAYDYFDWFEDKH